MKYFTVEEAESLLPQFTDIFRAALATKVQIEKKVENWRATAGKLTDADAALYQGQVEFLASQLEKQLGEIAAAGALPKDLDAGLVDFPARIEDREGYLCWRLGEERITTWHGLTEGFQGRRPLKREEHNG